MFGSSSFSGLSNDESSSKFFVISGSCSEAVVSFDSTEFKYRSNFVQFAKVFHFDSIKLLCLPNLFLDR